MNISIVYFVKATFFWPIVPKSIPVCGRRRAVKAATLARAHEYKEGTLLVLEEDENQRYRETNSGKFFTKSELKGLIRAKLIRTQPLKLT